MSEPVDRSAESDASGAPISFGSLGAFFASGGINPPRDLGEIGHLDDWPLLRQIGAGGMGVVFESRDPTTGQRMAIKLLRPELVHDRQLVHRFLVESRHMRQLAHPHILPVAHVFEPPQNPGYAAPFMSGGSLGARLVPGEPVDPATILTIAKQIGSALAYAHGKGIIHRDLKPANLLLDENGTAYLSDFGLVRTVFNDTMADVSRGHREGTAAYMSPAVAQGRAEDTRCDIYSFGAMLYEMLVGGPPYEGRGTEQILQQVIAGPPEPILRRNPRADAGLVAVSEGCMARELRDRYAQMADVLSDLDRLKDGLRPLGPRGTMPPTRPRLLRIAAAAVAVIVLGAVAVFSSKLWTPHADVARNPNPSGPGTKISDVQPGSAPSTTRTGEPMVVTPSAMEARVEELAKDNAEVKLDGLPVTDADLAPLEQATGIEVLSLNRTAVTDAGLSHLQNLTSLRALYLGDTKVDGRGLGALAGLRGLQRLSLSNCPVTDKPLIYLRPFSNLRSLSLRETKVTDAGMREIAGLTHLRDLDLWGLPISDDGLLTLRNLTALETLGLRGTQVSDRGVASLQDMRWLTWLDLEGTRVTGRSFAHLSRLTRLRTLKLDGSWLNGPNSSNLAAFANLHELTLSKTPIGDKDLESLEALQTIEELSLGETKVTDEGIACLEPLLKLAKLDLHRTQVGDEGIGQLRGLSGITDLNCDCTRISDAGLAELKALHQLHKLSIVGDDVSDAAVKDLRRALPACVVRR